MESLGGLIKETYGMVEILPIGKILEFRCEA
jgi:hypothetical protein